MNYELLSVKNLNGIPKFATQWLMKITATVVSVVSVARVAFVSLENLSVTIAINWLPVFVFGMGPEDIDRDRLYWPSW